MQFGRLDKIFIAFTAALIAALAGAGYWLQASMENKLTAHLVGDGLVIARVISRSLPAVEPAGGMDTFCSAHSDDTHLRVTLVEADGRVAGESHRSSAGMENHRERPEIRDALQTGSGWAIRHSDTLDMDMLYVAVRTGDGGRVVRVALPTSQLRRVQSEIMLVASIFLYLVPLLAALILYGVVRHVTRETGARSRRSGAQ